jgi:hypothetical protein
MKALGPAKSGHAALRTQRSTDARAGQVAGGLAMWVAGVCWSARAGRAVSQAMTVTMLARWKVRRDVQGGVMAEGRGGQCIAVGMVMAVPVL